MENTIDADRDRQSSIHILFTGRQWRIISSRNGVPWGLRDERVKGLVIDGGGTGDRDCIWLDM